jgi:formylglycine-generating enzyme required for sulfatase activity
LAGQAGQGNGTVVSTSVDRTLINLQPIWRMNPNKFADSLPPGSKLLWYEITKVLGKGGFGVTYLAKDSNLDQFVAIKEYLPVGFAVRQQDGSVLPNSPEDRKKFDWGLERFLKEAQVLARFKHPSIVRVMSFFRDSNTAYIVMEYEAGESLENILKIRGTLSEREISHLLLPLLDALEILHQADYIHRDIKPANILVRKSGVPVILDFGSARQAVTGQANSQMTSLLSLGYSPFEQYDSSGARQGPWSDIYAMGGVLYRAVVGRKPVDAAVRISAKLRGDPDPMTSAAEAAAGRCSPSFLQAIDRALMVLETDRPQNVAAWRPMFLGIPMEDGTTGTESTSTSRTTSMVEPLTDSPGPTEARSRPTQGNSTASAQKKSSWRSFISSMHEFGSVYKEAFTVMGSTASGGGGTAARPARGDTTAQRSSSMSSPDAAAVPDASSSSPRSGPSTPPPIGERTAGTLWTEPTTQIDFLWAPPGRFMMGSSKDAAGRKQEEMPLHEVELDGFWIGRYPVTLTQWKRVMGAPKATFGSAKDACPVDRILWDDTQEFIRKFARMTHSRFQVRLPTEAEWEYAARAGSSSVFYFGDDPSLLDQYCWYIRNSNGQTQPVGQKPPNNWGLCDALGNVWEWTSDWYSEDYYNRSPLRNPTGAAVGDFRVRRGGSWRSQPSGCRLAHRNKVSTDSNNAAQGFRLVLIDDQPVVPDA